MGILSVFRRPSFATYLKLTILISFSTINFMISDFLNSDGCFPISSTIGFGVVGVVDILGFIVVY